MDGAMEMAAQYGIAGFVLLGVFVVVIVFLVKVVLPCSRQWIASEKVRNNASEVQNNALMLICGEMTAARRTRERERAA